MTPVLPELKPASLIVARAIWKREMSRSLSSTSLHGSKAEASLFLEDALVDYSPDRMGGQLTIKAPNAKMPRVSDDSPIEDRINYVLYNEVNPSLAAHGGEVSLIEVTEDQFAVLQFGGGCQGCSAVDMTLKGGVEKTLLEQIPQLAGVRDNTDHSDRTQAYY
jgi:Fe/S biogenesis protein NfuA